MIIDFHTHTFPDELAERAVGSLAESARISSYLDGTTEDLRSSMKDAGIDYSVLLPVATKPEQQSSINKIAIEVNRHSQDTGLISFGGIHPDNEDYRQILRNLARNGVKGIKLHPVFQKTFLDDIRYLRIISCACEQDLIILIHAGYDISHPDWEYSTVPHIVSMLDVISPRKLVLAHMGGWNCWAETEKYLAGRDVWLDTSFSLLPLRHVSGTAQKMETDHSHMGFHAFEESDFSSDTAQKTETDHSYRLSQESFLRMVKTHGTDRILFGSDSPWGGQAETIAALKDTGLTDDELYAILGDNAARLLHL